MFNEKTTIELINKVSGAKLRLAKSKFSSYDAEDSRYIVEIKNRRKYYKDKLIEAYKLFANFQKSQLKEKVFLYVVTDEKGVWVYNISKNIESVLNTPLNALECPRTTDFNNNSKIIKYSYVLPEDMATRIK